MDISRIRTLSEYYRGGIKRLANKIGMSEQNLHRCIRENKIQAQDLEKIAKELGVGVELFYKDNITLEQYNPKGKYAFAAKYLDKVETHELVEDDKKDDKKEVRKDEDPTDSKSNNDEIEALKRENVRLNELNETKDVSIKSLLMTIEAKDEIIAFLKEKQK